MSTTTATKVRSLTEHNVWALATVGRSVVRDRGATWALLHGTREEALAAVQAVMDAEMAAGRGKGQLRSSLVAVRNKLTRGEARHVAEVTIEAPAVEAPAVELEPAAEVAEVEAPAAAPRKGRSVAQHVTEVLAAAPVGTFLTITEIAAADSSQYAAGECSTGAVTNALFPPSGRACAVELAQPDRRPGANGRPARGAWRIR